MTGECMPCIVKALGEQVNMTPIAWAEYADRVVIVFEQGPKLVFQRTIEAEPEPAPEPVKKPAPKAKKPRKKAAKK